MKNIIFVSYPVRRVRILTALALFLFSGWSHAIDGINVSSNSGLALHGYDPVAYFVSSEPTPGDDAFIQVYQGISWRFANEENKQAFAESPQKYMPQYGGHCAYAASKNAIADIDPAAWTIHNDKLYLNYSKSVRSKWRVNRDSNIQKADGYWPLLSLQVK
jgi:YHS domain-containing protein